MEYSKEIGIHPRTKKKITKSNHVDIMVKQAHRRRAGHLYKGPPKTKKSQGKRSEQKLPENLGHKHRVKRTTEKDGDNSTNSGDNFFCRVVSHLKQVEN